MKSSSVNKTFIFISSNKFIIISLGEANKINYKKETIFKNQNTKFDLDLFSEFLNENIFTNEDCIMIIRSFIIKAKKFFKK